MGLLWKKTKLWLSEIIVVNYIEFFDETNKSVMDNKNRRAVIYLLLLIGGKLAPFIIK